MQGLNTFLNSKKTEKLFITLLRLSLAIIYIWFGALKIFGFNPVYDLVYFSMMPWFAAGTGLVVLGVFETVIGLLLLTNRFATVTHVLVFFHLLGTFSTFLFGFDVVFEPRFPILTLEGEFVVKNLTLAMAGLVVLSYENRKIRSTLKTN